MRPVSATGSRRGRGGVRMGMGMGCACMAVGTTRGGRPRTRPCRPFSCGLLREVRPSAVGTKTTKIPYGNRNFVRTSRLGERGGPGRGCRGLDFAILSAVFVLGLFQEGGGAIWGARAPLRGWNPTSAEKKMVEKGKMCEIYKVNKI